jgi:hypothetical protein
MSARIDSPWITGSRAGYLVQTPYHPELGPLLRQIGRWSLADRAWRVPRSAGEQLACIVPTIDRLARQATLSGGGIASPSRDGDDLPRPLCRDYMVCRNAAPRHAFTLQRPRNSEAKVWLAQILATDPRRGWVRVFLDGTVDYGESTKRTLVINYALGVGPIYEVCRIGKRGREQRGFLRIEDGVERWMTETEVRACLDLGD